MKMLPETQYWCQRIPGYLFPVKIYLSGLMLFQVMILQLRMSLWPSKFPSHVSMAWLSRLVLTTLDSKLDLFVSYVLPL